jgi:hypothetical protein
LFDEAMTISIDPAWLESVAKLIEPLGASSCRGATLLSLLCLAQAVALGLDDHESASCVTYAACGHWIRPSPAMQRDGGMPWI